MKLVMTLMVRDEVDVVGAMLAHHRSQGIDHAVVTDNGSVDGTTEILRRYADDGFVTLWHDPVHRKQQHTVVTKMARYAAEVEGADWVINADADEFWMPSVGSPYPTVREALIAADAEAPYLDVPVVNLTGLPAKDGSGFGRLIYRDLRTDEQLHAAGIPFHPTHDAVHRGNPAVEVAQGNHFVTAPGWGEGRPAEGFEVLHLPWRSWRQYSEKVQKAGAAYEANPELFPSPRHHGMQDYRRWKAGRLQAAYVAKHPSSEELDRLVADRSLIRDDRLAHLATLPVSGAIADELFDPAELDILATYGRLLAGLESENEERMQELRDEQAYERSIWLAARSEAAARIDGLEHELDHRESELRQLHNRRTVRAADRLRALGSKIGRHD